MTQPFKAGRRRGQLQVPKGRLNKCRHMQFGDTTLVARGKEDVVYEHEEQFSD